MPINITGLSKNPGASKAISATLGLATVLPVAYFIFFVSWLFSCPPSGIRELACATFDQLFIWHAAALVLSSVLLLSFIFHLRRLDLSPERKRFWTGMLLLASLFVFPLFWYRFIWSSRNRAAGAR